MRIEQKNTFFLDIIKDIRSQKLAKAPFNRDYAWNQNDVIMLFESIKKEYPIGNIITWQPPEKRDYSNRLGPIFFEEQPTSFIIDGHNRLATMAYSMASQEEIENTKPYMTEQEKDVWGRNQTLIFNGLTDEIKFLNNDELENERNIIPIGFVANLKLFSSYVRKNYDKFDNDNVIENIDKLSYKILETRLINMSMDRVLPEQAIDAFTHLAKVGQPMSEKDIEFAKEWFHNEEPISSFKI